MLQKSPITIEKDGECCSSLNKKTEYFELGHIKTMEIGWSGVVFLQENLMNIYSCCCDY